ncbi:MAG: hypothetical protein AB1716_21365 [Planctomycetota bacterium]
MRSYTSWFWLSRPRRLLTGVGLLALLVGLAEMHACACTGGRPEWRPVFPDERPVAVAPAAEPAK